MTEANDITVRLAKRLAAEHSLSRSTAEQYIEGGWVSVDGQVVELPGARVAPQQRVELAPDASLLELTPVTLLLHKPPGYEAGLGLEAGNAAHGSRSQGAPSALTLLNAQSHLPEDAADIRVLLRHFKQLECFTPLPRRPAVSWSTRRTNALRASCRRTSRRWSRNASSRWRARLPTTA